MPRWIKGLGFTKCRYTCNNLFAERSHPPEVCVVGGGGCSKELPLLLISFGGGVHNMDKKVPKFSSEKKTKNN